MSLDLTKVAPQVTSMVTQLQNRNKERQEQVDRSLGILKSTDFEKLKRKIAASHTTWLVAGLVEELDVTHPLPPLPAEYTIVATDGSQIDIDRHRTARCYLINISTVMLRYGAYPAAELNNYPHLYSTEEEMVITQDNTNINKQVIDSALLGIKRNIEECSYLAKLSEEIPTGSTGLALMDGTLILWGLSGNVYPDFVIEILLKNGLLQHLENIRKMNKDRKLVVASYISFPRSNDVINSLRVSLCPHEVVNTDRYCENCVNRECSALSDIQDRDLFANLLKSGERSALFMNNSSIVKSHYGPHRVYFFYLNVNEEIARIEIPEWIALDKDLVNTAHSLIIEQCKKGQGYPVALSEAHEQAVITGNDRENFWNLIESSMIDEKFIGSNSVKSRSKRTRWV
jgi:hypothetical protein